MTMDFWRCSRPSQVSEPASEKISSVQAHKQKSALKKGLRSMPAPTVVVRDLRSAEDPCKERDLIVQRHRKVMTQAKLKVTYFLLNNGFKRIDVNCRKRVHLGLAVTYPLHVAAVHNDHDMVKLLLHFGADPYKKDSWGRTACCCTQSGQVQKLLKKVGGGLLESKWIQRPFRNPVPAGLEDFFAEVERDPVVQSLKRSREKYRQEVCGRSDL
eukprot:CAMPEP_0181444242 /NCGR_PEP_ID=MMETSP1110-20121109/24964_1 /TAXON_ID=174948 /ORGANISM="Symbiodinium sp., Strain CCMP421" /LENGTH=212 /DNA_ID=CAMNT_0023568235 /DNA_START=18 /DNA_END=656 /DNA_ORIENTATION=+